MTQFQLWLIDFGQHGLVLLSVLASAALGFSLGRIRRGGA